ncbi:hypothetical protein IEQ34_001917 [Dendrobium chrysotoxum]|uniref:Uncharacterized protein n=1 Tax=Dendrobium chrysotoxum TaxID=161865 RepID=A0AAV7HKH8_DENCH|nr:hypothetical protein IEQ34_001917 [Dendrobium chrysotoxum]
MNVEESDLSTWKLEEFQRELEVLQKEKPDHLKQISNKPLWKCILVLDDAEGSDIVSNEVIDKLVSVIQRLREIKLQRKQKLQDLATTMLELWNLVDTPMEQHQLF